MGGIFSILLSHPVPSNLPEVLCKVIRRSYRGMDCLIMNCPFGEFYIRNRIELSIIVTCIQRTITSVKRLITSFIILFEENATAAAAFDTCARAFRQRVMSPVVN